MRRPLVGAGIGILAAALVGWFFRRPLLRLFRFALSSSDLESLTKEELYRRAQQADIPGRSEMTKDELVRALKGR